MTHARAKTFRDLPILGYRKDGRAIYPILGGDETADAAAQAAAATAAAAGNQQQNTGPVEATDENGVALGFPSETKVEDMNSDQKAAYWRNQAKVQQKKVPSNLAELQAAAEKWNQYQQSQQTPADQQIQQARTEAANAARLEAAEESTVALLRVTLHTRGKSDEEIDELLQFTSARSFLTDNKMDAAKVTSFVDKIAPSGSGGGGGGLPGQGRHDQQQAPKSAAGKSEAERRGFKPATGTSSLLPSTT